MFTTQRMIPLSPSITVSSQPTATSIQLPNYRLFFSTEIIPLFPVPVLHVNLLWFPTRSHSTEVSTGFGLAKNLWSLCVTELISSCLCFWALFPMHVNLNKKKISMELQNLLQGVGCGSSGRLLSIEEVIKLLQREPGFLPLTSPQCIFKPSHSPSIQLVIFLRTVR